MIRRVVRSYRTSRNDDVLISANFIEIGAQAKRELHHADVRATARNHEAIEAVQNFLIQIMKAVRAALESDVLLAYVGRELLDDLRFWRAS